MLFYRAALPLSQTLTFVSGLVRTRRKAIASLVGKLVECGWLERLPHSRHATVQELHLTDSGRWELAGADRLMVYLDHHLLDSLGEEECQHLCTLLDDVMKHLPPWMPPNDTPP